MKKKITALLLVLVMLLMSGCTSYWGLLSDNTQTPGTPAVATSDLEFNNELGKTDFGDMKYEHYDATKVKAMISALQTKVSDVSYEQQMLEDFQAIEEEMYSLCLSYELAELETYRDSTNDYYQEEYQYINEVYQDVYDLYCTLGRAILDSPCGEMARENWKESDIEVFEKYEPMTDEQKALKKQETALISKYRKESVKAFSYNINGKDYVLEDLQAAYYGGLISYEQYVEAYYGCFDAMEAALGVIYVDLVKVRQKLAKAYGYDDYSAYAYEKTYDRDYTVEEAAAFCAEVKNNIIPAYSRFNSTVSNYDNSSLDEKAKSYSEEEKLDLVRPYLKKVNPILETYFDYMRDYHLYDVEQRETKFSAGFTMFIDKYNQPYFFSQPNACFYDIMTDVHEFGHFNSYCINYSAKGQYQNIDLAEIHSQGLEMLYTNFYGEMIGSDYEKAAEVYTLQQKISSIIEGCLYDEFQRRVYQLDNPTVEEINRIFGELLGDYYPMYYSGSEPERMWILVSHNFESPLYYISYAVSVVPAIEIWHMSKSDFDEAAETYMEIVCAGEADGYKATLKEIGINSPFESGTMAEVAEWFSEY